MILTLTIAESAIGLLQCFGYLPSENNLFPMTGTFKNPGPLGGFVTVGLSVAIPCLFLFMTRDQKEVDRLSCLIKIASLLTFILGMIVLPASMSRAAWLALIVALSLFAYREKKFRLFFKRKRYLIGILIVLLLTFMAITFAIKKDSALGRFHIWNIECKAILKSPLTGYGYNTALGVYGETQAEYFSQKIHSDWAERVAGAPEYAFNEYLKVSIEYGIPVMLLFVSVLVFAVKSLIKQNSPMAYGMISLCIFAFFSYPFSLWQFNVALFFFIISAVPSHGVLKVCTPFALSLFILYGAIVVIPTRISERSSEVEWLKLNSSVGRVGDAAIEEYERLYDDLKGNSRFIYDYGVALRKNYHYEKSNKILSYGVKYSSDPMFHNVMGDNYKDMNEYDKAENEYIFAHNMVPSRLYPLVLLMELYVSIREYDKAFAIGESVLRMPVNVRNMPMRKLRYRTQMCMDSLKIKHIKNEGNEIQR